jgi:hypothetical protein
VWAWIRLRCACVSLVAGLFGLGCKFALSIVSLACGLLSDLAWSVDSLGTWIRPERGFARDVDSSGAWIRSGRGFVRSVDSLVCGLLCDLAIGRGFVRSVDSLEAWIRLWPVWPAERLRLACVASITPAFGLCGLLP